MHRADFSAFGEDADPASVLAAVLGETELREALEESAWEEDGSEREVPDLSAAAPRRRRWPAALRPRRVRGAGRGC
jgi:hypothetical protein